MTEPLTKKEKAHRAAVRAEAREAHEAPLAPPLATPAADGVGDRGVEQNVPWYTDSAGRKFVAAPHPQAGSPW